jgi:hypothetical protein
MMSDIDNARRKILGYIKEVNLPAKDVDPEWKTIQEACSLTPDELGALKLAILHPSKASRCQIF